MIVSISHLLKRNKRCPPFSNRLELNSFTGEMGGGRSCYSPGKNSPKCIGVTGQKPDSMLRDIFLCASIIFPSLNFK